MDRKEAYAKIKELGLQDVVQKKTGKNFTQCGTAVLIEIIENAEKKATKKTAAPAAKEKKPAEAGKDVIEAAVKLINEMRDAGAISEDNAMNLIGVLHGEDPLPVEEPEDFDDMFNNW